MKRSRKNRHAWSLCAAWLLVCAWLPSMAADDVEARLRGLMAEHETVGLAVVVARDNAIVYRGSFGWKDLEAKVPLEADDLFRIASISKSFAATSVMQLVEQGRLSLDDDAGDLIGFPVRNPAFPDRPITLRMLLDHTSSITDGQSYGNLDVIDPGAGGAWRDSYADRAPGERYEYSNLAYNMVGTIVERVSGERLGASVRRRGLRALGRGLCAAGRAPAALRAGPRRADVLAHRRRQDLGTRPGPLHADAHEPGRVGRRARHRPRQREGDAGGDGRHR